LVDVPLDDSPIVTFVRMEQVRNNSSNWKGKVTYWYAPSLSADVKIFDEAFDEMDKQNTYNLINYTLP